MEVNFKNYKICLAAMQLFSEKGFENVTMMEIAEAASIDEATLYINFGNKHDLVLFLYQSVNTDWQLFIDELPVGKLADRFEKALIAKIELMDPYSDVLGNMIGHLLQNSKIAYDAPQTAHIRKMGHQSMGKLIEGANDTKTLEKKIANLPSLLYMMHWAVLFLHLQTGNKAKTVASIKMMTKLLQRVNTMSFTLNFFPFIQDLGAWAEQLTTEIVPSNQSINREIFKIISNCRKVSEASKKCLENKCETCLSQHDVQINYFTSQNLPIHFILPAFPAKSPNHTKVLGDLPDLGEEIALTTLENLCKEIGSIYKPGAFVTIGSDGRIFSELVGVTDEVITDYVNGIKALIKKNKLKHINIVNLEDLMEGTSFDLLRNKVIETYAEPMESLKSKLTSLAEFKNLFNGIHRFISEDRKVLYPDKSSSKIKEESKSIALKVIQHSNAWTRFLVYVFPNSIRLSIHPYPAHSDKIGIRLTKASDNWITPWHGVIVLDKDGYLLMKRSEAVAKGAQLITENNQPYYYTLIPK